MKYLSILIFDAKTLDQFLKDFEGTFALFGANIELHWYRFLRICFIKACKEKLELYLWFTRRLDEGLSWCDAKAILQLTFGYRSVKTEEAIRFGIEEYKLPVGLSFQNYFKLYRTCAGSAEFMADANTPAFTYQQLLKGFMKNISNKKLSSLMVSISKSVYKAKKSINLLPIPVERFLEDENDVPTRFFGSIFVSWPEFQKHIEMNMA